MQALLPFMNEVRDDLTSLKECLISLNETVIQLSGDLEEHKNLTKSELVDLPTSLQSSIDNPPTKTVSGAVLLKLLPYMNNNEKSLMTDLSSLISDRAASIDEALSSLRKDLEDHKNWTKTELADLHTSSDNPPIEMISRAVLLTLLPYMNSIEENHFTDLTSLISDRATSINNSVSSLKKDLVEFDKI